MCDPYRVQRRPANSSPRPYLTARETEAGSRPSSIRRWRSSLSAPQRRKSQAMAPNVTIEPRQVPDVQVDRPERQRDQRMGEDTPPLDEAELQHRLEQWPVQPGDERERSEVAEQDVLGHVGPQELLLAEGIERRGQRENE